MPLPSKTTVWWAMTPGWVKLALLVGAAHLLTKVR